MALTFDPTAQAFIPGWDLNSNIQQVDPQLEYNDAFLEYAYANGLWGLPGANHEPSENEFTNMRQQFADHWMNIHGYNENIDYFGEEDDDEDIFFPDNDEDAMIVGDDDGSDETPVVLNNFHCAECGIAQGENVILEGDSTNGEIYCQECWDEYEEENGDSSNWVWSDIAVEFQDYCDYYDLFNDRLPGDLNFRIVEDAWDRFVDHTFSEEYRHWAYVLADSNEWAGVFTATQTEEVRALRLQ